MFKYRIMPQLFARLFPDPKSQVVSNYFLVVTFNHRSVFPIMFDGTAVDNWWKSALIFKLFARSTGQKVVCIILNLPNIHCKYTLQSLLY